MQYRIRLGVPLDDVLAQVRARVTEAARAGAVLVVLPELFVLDGWPALVDDEPAYVRSVAETVSPTVLETLRALARSRGVAILGGSMPESRDGRLYNTARLVFPDGREVRQDKMFPTRWGRAMGMTPGDGLEVFDAPWGRSVILVCYDVEFPTLSARLGPERPEVILVPSMTESVHGLNRVRWSAQARAVEHHAFVVIAGTVGRPQPSWQHFGQAVFLTPRSEGFPGVLNEGPLGAPGVVLGDLDLERLRASRDRTGFYPALDALRRTRDLDGVPALDAPSRPPDPPR